LWDRGGQRYMIEEMAADIASGHNIVGDVYVGLPLDVSRPWPGSVPPVGEVEFANGVAAMSASGGYGPPRSAPASSATSICCSVKARDPVLEAEITGRPGGVPRHPALLGVGRRSRGRRHVCTRPKGLLLDPTFRKGFSVSRRWA